MCNQYKVKNYTQEKNKHLTFLFVVAYLTVLFVVVGIEMHRDAKHTNPRGLDVISKSATTLGKKPSKLQLSSARCRAATSPF